MARRANGEGSIYKESTGRYRIAITVMVDGKPKRLTATAWKHSVALEKLKSLRSEYNPSLAASRLQTVGDLLQRWMDKHCRPAADNPKATKIAPSTLNGRERALKLHTLPYIGKKPLKSFGPTDVEDFVDALRKKKLGGAATRWVWDVCRSAFAYGLKYSIVTTNPFTVVRCPRYEVRKMKPFTADEVNALLSETEGTRLHALLVMMFYTGMRQGELFGLRWDRVNMQEQYLFIDQQAVEVAGKTYITKPKTKSSIRRVALAPIVIAALQSHKAILLREGNAGNELVFPGVLGGIQGRANFWCDQWKPLLARLGIEHRGAHNTRHTFASTAIADGNDGAVISQILGHKNTSTTLNTYTHALSAQEAKSVKKIDQMFG